jgi:hypothetical protein
MQLADLLDHNLLRGILALGPIDLPHHEREVTATAAIGGASESTRVGHIVPPMKAECHRSLATLMGSRGTARSATFLVTASIESVVASARSERSSDCRLQGGNGGDHLIALARFGAWCGRICLIYCASFWSCQDRDREFEVRFPLQPTISVGLRGGRAARPGGNVGVWQRSGPHRPFDKP